MITDKAIKAAILSVERGSSKTRDLADPSERGGGRLHLKCRPAKGRVSAEFFVSWKRAGSRRSAKLGSYPSMLLGAARKAFREDYLPLILRGENPVGPRAVVARGGGTVKDLFTAYVENLGERPHAKSARQVLLGRNGAANAIGANRPAAAIRAAHVVPHLATIFDRGAVCQANNVRNIIHAAFEYAIKSANSYFNTAGARNWDIARNPISDIPCNTTAYAPRDRALSEAELGAFWRWLEQSRGTTRAYDAIRLEIATGQRACEILAASVDSYDRERGHLTWRKTKNGLPHCIPLPRQAVEILDGLQPNEHGLYFPGTKGRSEKARSYVIARIVRLYIEETGALPFEARDLRRTWKTLAGAAGIPKFTRDRIQNHARSDISSKHYDRWEYLPEMTAGMRVWEAYLERILQSDIRVEHERLPPLETLVRLRDNMGSQVWRAAPQARHHPDWIGVPVAATTGLERAGEWREEALKAALRLERQGVLVRSLVRDHKSRHVPVLSFDQAVARGVGLPDVPAIEAPVRLRRSSTIVPIGPEVLQRLDVAMESRAWRAAPQSLRQPDWIGIPIAAAFELDRRTKWKSTANTYARALREQGYLEGVMGEDDTGRAVPKYILRPVNDARDVPASVCMADREFAVRAS